MNLSHDKNKNQGVLTYLLLHVSSCPLCFIFPEMNNKLNLLFSFICLLLYTFFSPFSSLPLCSNLRAPATPNKPLAFCPYNGKVCCDSSKDLQLQKLFKSMNVSDAACSSIVKSILCSTCDQFSAELFKVKSGPGPRPVPVLCNSTTKNSFCSSVWDSCQKVPITNSPFAPSLKTKAEETTNSNSSLLTDFWQSKSDFCEAFGGNSNKDSLCFSGEQVSLVKNETSQPPNGMCLERVADGAYLNMVPHPDGSNRAFFSSQPGKIWLATIPEQDSGESMVLDESTPFADLTDEVYLDARFGMMGMVFHPNFAKNGRFFASYNCDKAKSPNCAGRCACNSDVGCDPSKINSEADQPCQYHTVVAEFSVNGTASNPSMAQKAKPSEVRRIFTMGLPSSTSHGGQILFGPEDGYLYIMMGDGGSKGDTFNFAQNKKSLLGKIMRVDIDNIPSQEEIADLGHWGNYSVPRDNPYSEDKDLQPEIWALGLRNPWRCSFDSERPSYFICADIGQDHYEEVDIITKGGNYGWSMFEGPLRFKNVSVNDSMDLIFPVLGYNHSDVNKEVGSAAISGGYVYRSKSDPCMYGSYLYGDLYAKNFWAAQENPYNSGNFTTRGIPFSCAHDSPLNCSSVPNSPLPALGYIFSSGEDNKKDTFVLTSTGVYRVVRPSRCNYTCAKETVRAAESPGPSAPSDGHMANADFSLVLVLYSLLLLTSFIL